MIGDYITPAERLRPPSRLLRFAEEVFTRYRYKIACHEMDAQAKHAAEWRWVQLQCEDKLKALGVDPNEQPEDITKMLELYLVVALIAGFAVLGFVFSAYKGALLQLIGG